MEQSVTEAEVVESSCTIKDAKSTLPPSQPDVSMPSHAQMEDRSLSANEEPICTETKEEPMGTVNSMDMETKQELMSMIAEMEERTMSVTKDQPVDMKSEVEPSVDVENDDDSVDIVEKMRSVWALDEDEDEQSQHEKYVATTSDEESDYENEFDVNAVERTTNEANVAVDDDEDDSAHSDEHSYLPGSLQSSPERSSTAIPLPDSFPSMTVPLGLLDTSSPNENAQLSSAAGMPLLSKNDHDIPSMYMPHRQTSASQILDTTEPKPFEDATRVHADLPKKPSVIEDEEGEANIHHIAKVTFDGNPAKGQLSFMSGSEVLAHSNQRGEWWLGRCGGRTGWFPASAVVPASEYLSCDGPSLGEHNTDEEEVDDVDLEFPQLSQEEIHEVYDLIRSPSGEDESPRKAAAKDAAAPKLDPSDSTEEQPNELFVNGQRDIRSAYDSMLDEYDSMLAPASEQSNAKEDRSLNVSAETKQSELNTITSSGEKKPKRLWRSANDPNTGLTYYYNVKTREVSDMSEYASLLSTSILPHTICIFSFRQRGKSLLTM